MIYNNDQEVTAIQFVNEDTAYAIGAFGEFIKSFNGGVSWSENALNNPGNNPSALHDMSFVNGKTGFIVGQLGRYGIIYKTTDAGLNWTTRKSILNSSLLDCYFLNKNEGYVVGSEFDGSYRGVFYKTNDGGVTWNEKLITPPGNSLIFRGVTFINSNKGFIVGEDITGSNQRMVVYTTNNGGATWAPSYLGSEGELLAIQFISSEIGYISGATFGTRGCGESRIFKTTNGGDTWTSENTGSIIYATPKLHFPSPNTGYIFERCFGPNVNGAFFKVMPQVTTDIKPDLMKTSVNIYPNPVSQTMTLESDDDIQEVTFYSIEGKEQCRYPISNTSKVQITIPELSAGWYLVEVKTGKGSSMYKISVIKGIE